MAVVLFKSLLAPLHHQPQIAYQPLRFDAPSTNNSADLERASDTSNEKPPHNAPASTVWRVHPRTLSDATIGLADGLTVPFALTAGLSALGDARVVIYAGLAELIAGGISMGLGGYLGARAEAEAYAAALVQTRALVHGPESEGYRAEEGVRAAFAEYDFPEAALQGMVQALQARPEQMVGFLMRFQHGLEDAAECRAYKAGLTIMLGYVCGGLVALLPYLVIADVRRAFVGSVAVMAVALFAFGWAKTALVGETDRKVCAKNAVQMLVLGGVAAAAAVSCVKVIGD